MDPIAESVSPSTLRHWGRLGVSPKDKRLDSRANKRMSRRRFVPVEYLFRPETEEFILSTVGQLTGLLGAGVPSDGTLVPGLIAFLCLDLLRHRGLVHDSGTRLSARTPSLNRFVLRLAAESAACPNVHGVALNWPDGEFDILGALYQCLVSEGSKNRRGSYYTPPYVVDDMVGGLHIPGNGWILDPGCGTGAFLLRISGSDPNRFVGFDTDPAAVLMAKTNLFLSYSELDFEPAIYALDFLRIPTHKMAAVLETDLGGEPAPGGFDVVLGNPPWGVDRKLRNPRTSTGDVPGIRRIHSRLHSADISNPGTNGYGSSVYMDPHVRSGERFALFLSRAVEMLHPGGQLAFLLPNAFLEVKTHMDIRRRVLDTLELKRIRQYGRSFSKVFTNSFSLTGVKRDTSLTVCNGSNTANAESSMGECSRFILVEDVDGSYGRKGTDKAEKKGKAYTGLIGERGSVGAGGSLGEGGAFFVDARRFIRNPNVAFRLVRKEDAQLVDRILGIPHRTLSDSVWALGIVTGNNAKWLTSEPGGGREPVLTGREIQPYVSAPPRYYIEFRPAGFQQTAPESVYRSCPKLLYRFVFDRLVFAYDSKGTLALNSANILVPRVPGYCAKSVLAMLNSELFNYIYRIMFSDLKILKGNLCRLPFPEIGEDEERKLARLAEERMAGDLSATGRIQNLVYALFQCTAKEIERVQAALVRNGR